MVAILYPRRLRELRDVTQPGVGLPDQGVPQLQSSNSSFVVETIAGGGGFSLGASNLGNTVGATGVTGSRVVLAGIGNLTLSQATDINGGTISISAGSAAAGAFSAGVSGGNTSGNTGITGTRLVFAGGNSITLSQATDVNGGTITISGATTSQSLQTQGLFDLTIDGNTAGVGALVSSGTLTLAGGSNITLSQNGNAISIIGNAAGTETQVAVSGIANSQTTYTSGTVSLGALGALTIRSTTGNQFQFSVNSQSVQPETQTFIGGVVASNTTYTSGTVNIVGSGIVTVQSGTGQRVIVNASQSVQPETQTFLGGLAGSNTTYTSGTVTLTGVGGGVTVSSNTGQRIDISVAAPVAQTVQTQNMVAATLSGNTSGALALMSSGTMTIAGGNNITVSQAGNAFTISGPNVGGAQTGISGLANSQTTYTSGTVSLSELGAITIRSTTGNQFQFSVNSQSVQPETQTFVGGIKNSQTTYTSGTIGLSELGAITIRSTTGNQFQLSVAAQSVQPETQTFIGGLAGSNTTYTSGTVTITGVGGGVTVSSNTGQRIDISVAAPVAQTGTQFSAGISGGNTSGNSGTVAGRVVFAGGNNITLSGSTNGVSETITISAPNAQTAISGLANSQTTYTSGTVSLSELGAITIRSTTGNQYQFSVNSQTVQTQNMVAVTLSGNTSGVQALISSGTLTLAGGNNITVSQAGNAVTISGPNVGGAQTGISGLANSQTTYTSGTVSLSELGAITIRSTTGNQFQFSVNSQSVQPETQTFVGGIANSQTTYTSGTVSLSELGAITIRSTTGNQFQISVNSQSVQTQSLFSAGVSTGGNTAGDTGITGTRLVFVGSQNITLSQATAAAGGTVTIQGPATAAQTADSGGAYAVGNTYSSSSGTFDVRTLSIRGDGIISVAATNSGWRISASQSVQPETQTFVGGIAASNTTYTSGTISFTGVGGGVTVSSNTGQRVDISVAAPVAQTGTQFSMGLSNIGNTSGDTVTVAGRVVLAGSNGITLSGSSNGVSQTITISGITQSVESQSIGMSNLGNTSGTTGIASGGQVRFLFAGAGEVTLSQSLNGASGTLTISSPVQTVESQSIGASNLGNTLGTSGVASGGQVRAVIIGTSNITVSQSVNGASATMSLIGQPSFSAGLSTGGNTQGNTGVSGTRLVLVATNNITMSQATDASGATISISGQSPTGGQFSAGVSTGGNTAGATGISGSRIVFVGTNQISLSQTTDANGATISINDTVSAFQAGVSTGGNTTGDTGMTGTRMVFVGSSPISLSQATGANGGTISINAPATSSLSAVSGIVISTNGSTISIGYKQNAADWENMPRNAASLLTHVSAFSKTPIYWNDHIDVDLTAKSFAFGISMVTASQPLSLSAHLGVYTLVNSTSANLLGSVSEAYVVSSASSVSLSNVRNLIITGIGTHTALSTISQGEYLIGMMFSATATNAMNLSLLGASGGVAALGGIFPGTNQLSTGTSQGIQVLAGRGSTTVNAMPSAVSAADLVNQGTAGSSPLHPWIYIRS